MKTVQRLIFRDLAVTAALALAALNLVIMTEKVYRLTIAMARMGVSGADMARMLLLMQPQITVFTAPMALLVAVLAVYGRMNADSEVVVLRAAGMPFAAMAAPVFAMGIAGFALSAFISNYAAPACTARLADQMAASVARRLPYAVEEGVFNTMFKGKVIFVSRKPAPDVIEGVFIRDDRSGGDPMVLTAAKGRLTAAESGDGSALGFTLEDGAIYLIGNASSTSATFRKYSFSLPLPSTSSKGDSADRTGTAALLEMARSAPEGRARTDMFIELHRRFSIPLLTMVVAVLGVPLAFRAGKAGGLGGLVLGLGVLAMYYGLIVVSERTVTTGLLPHYIGCWLPALVTCGVATWLYAREAAK